MAQQTTQWILELIDKITSPMQGITNQTEKGQDKVDKLGKSFKDLSAIDLYAVSQSVGDLSRMLDSAAAPGIAFDAQMKEVQAITGLAGEQLDKLGESARESAKEFGGNASQMLESYKGIIARFGPDIASSDEAMAKMGNNVATLSKLMGNDAVGSMDALTTAMLQFGVDLSDPIAAAKEMERMMNVMAAAGNEGASEVDMTSAALKEAGVQAKNSNLSFEATNAALQILAQGGVTGSEAGVKLRNVLSKMAGIDVIPTEAAEKLKKLGVNYDIVSNKALPFTERLRELKKAQGDATIMAQIFGIQNDAAAQILLDNIDAQDQLSQKITGTTAAVDGANVIMSSYNEKIARMRAWVSDLGIRFFGITKNILPFIGALSGSVMVLANLANAKKGVLLLFNTLKAMPIIGSIVSGGFNLMSMAAKGFGVAIMNIPIIGWIAAVIAGLIALGAYFYNTSAAFRGFLWGLWEAVKTVFTGIGKFISEVLGGVWHIIKGVFNPANWFDDEYQFSDGLDKITNAAKTYGESIGKAFSEGREKGVENFNQANPEEKKTETKSKLKLSEVSPKIQPTKINLKTDKGEGKGLSGSGMGGVKNISQKIDIKNYFTVSANSDIESIANKVVDTISKKLRDGIVIAG